MFEMELCSRKQDIQRMLICKEMMTWYSVQDKSDGYTELEDYQPKYANMYKCSKQGSWLYAAARYEFIG